MNKPILKIVTISLAAMFMVCITACEKDKPEYEITITGENGSAQAKVAGKTVTKATEGEKVTLVPLPDKGYTLSKWTVMSGGVEISDNAFTMPAANVAIEAEFVEAPFNGFDYITDPVFNEYCQQFDTDSDGLLTQQEADEVTVIEMIGQPWTDNPLAKSLDGIEIFTNLIELYIPFHDIKALDLSGNVVLEVLECNNNDNLASIDVSKNIALTSMVCTLTNFASLDLSNNAALTYLDISGNMTITSLDISALTSLDELYCQMTSISSLDVSNNVALRYLNCGSETISDLDVSMLPELIGLATTFSRITSLDVSNNLKLKHLYINVCTGITNIDISKNTALETLTVSETSVPSIDLSNNPNLLQFGCSLTSFTSLDLSKNPALEHLDIFGCSELTSLDLSNNTKINYLVCCETNIPDLDFSKLPALEVLMGWNANFTSLDMSKNTVLEELIIYRNNLTDLDVSENVDLSYISIEENDLSKDGLKRLFASLPPRAAADMASLYCVDNPGNAELTDADILVAQSKNWTVTYQPEEDNGDGPAGAPNCYNRERYLEARSRNTYPGKTSWGTAMTFTR